MRTSVAALPIEGAPRRATVRRRRANRRVVIQHKPALVILADGVSALARGLWALCRVLAKILLLVGLVAGLGLGGRLAVRHIIASERFALRGIDISATERVPVEEIRALAGVAEGDRLLALDTDAIAARVAEHPWVKEARVRRQLPAELEVEVVERRAAAAVALGTLYLIDETGRPFKRATMEEAEGLPIITGLERAQYVDHQAASEAVFREVLALVAVWRARPGRPALSEVNLEPRYGFTLFLVEGGAEIRLGRGAFDRKLASLDQILEAVKMSGAGLRAVRVVHLDGESRDRITVRLAPTPGPPPAPRNDTATAEKG